LIVDMIIYGLLRTPTVGLTH